jgi:CheY-like chemotaxis protein
MAARKRVLVVDDEAGVRESIRILLSSEYEVLFAGNGGEALEIVERDRPNLVLLDIIMPGMDGMEVLERIKTTDATLPVVMLTATKTVKTAVAAMKLGAFDYLPKPFDVDELRLIAERATTTADLVEEVKRLRTEVRVRFSASNIVARSPQMQSLLRTVQTIAPLKTTVLITGESGTGKELVARALHAEGPRTDEPWVVLNCAAIPETLLESELFGHERGAFTDAHARKIGLFERAHRGTVFLDEIGEMSINLQAKRARDRGGAVSRRPLLSVERGLDPSSAAARTGGRHPVPDQLLPRVEGPGPRPAREAVLAARAGHDAGLQLAGKRSRARERGRARGRAHRRSDRARRRRPPRPAAVSLRRGPARPARAGGAERSAEPR